MRTTRPLAEAAVIGGATLSSLHLCWILLVASGWAQPFMDFIFRLHMLSSPFQVQPFSAGLALALIAITFLFGALYGLIFQAARQSLVSED